ncbi:MAG TPA: protein translocase subunit SecD [Gaiella sp.]|jgi:SecD/SecF fusion protein|nr:protein translocase subunit SecD [Gaiella sp.]
MTRRAAVFVVALVAAALVGVALLAVPGSPLEQRPTLGLDLQGGLEVTLQAVPPRDRELTKEDLDRSVSIMRSRVDKLGVAEPEIRTQGSDQISIQLPGVKDPAAAAQIIGKTAQLELFDLERDLVSPSIDTRTRQPIATPKLYDLLSGQQALAAKGTPESYYVFRTEGKQLVRGPVNTKESALARWGGKLPAGHKLFAVPPETVVVSCGAGAEVCPGVAEANPTATSWYLMRYTPPEVPEMTGEDLKLSGTRQDFDTRTGEPIVLMEFSDRGADKFEEITRDIAQRGRLLYNTVGGGQGDHSPFLQHFAIVLDREIKSWPTIDFQEYPGGITGSNGAQISGLADIGEAKDLALVLQTGALPVEFRTLDQTAISATLGKDSLEEAKTAALVGLLAVAIFLLVIYRFLGLVAVAGLIVYAALLYAAILLFNVTLTLPGIAGLVLTLGVAADANIVIFERIKEEVRAGRSVRAAIQTGYTKGFATIVDANVVTMITALVLFAVATASVRGFALMLLVGTAISMLTAVLATRAFLAVLAGLKMLDSPRLMGASGGGIPRWLKLDYIGRRNTWFAISGAVLLISLGAIAVKGLNLGIDFRGGTQVAFETPRPVPLEAVRAQAGKIGQANAQIQGRGRATSGDSYQSFTVRTESLTTSEVQSLQSGLTRVVDAESFGVKNVSASFGRQIARGAILAIIVSLLLIIIYISARFQWKFAVPVLIALAHDIIITVGIYALLGREVTTATVAAVLTVLGYSIYDTIIIFDRIRENMPLMKRASFRVIGNVSLWETIPRSLATTFITLLPIVSLLLFGGDTLKDFAFALFVGIGAGAYSSIFIAAPLVAMFKEREPEYARRRDDEHAVEESVGGALLGAPAEPPVAAPAPQTAVATTSAPAAPVAAADGPATTSSAGRERRRQRRSGRPHGRPR